MTLSHFSTLYHATGVGEVFGCGKAHHMYNAYNAAIDTELLDEKQWTLSRLKGRLTKLLLLLSLRSDD